MHQCTPTKLPGRLYNKHTCCNSMEAAQQDVFKSCSGPVNFIGDSVSRAGAEGHAEEGYRKKISAPATAMKGAANNTRQAYFIIPRVAKALLCWVQEGKNTSAQRRLHAPACVPQCTPRHPTVTMTTTKTTTTHFAPSRNAGTPPCLRQPAHQSSSVYQPEQAHLPTP